MNEKKVVHPIRGFFVLIKNLFLLASVLIAAFAVVGYFAGWIVVRQDQKQDKATIEIKTRQVKTSAEEAVEKGKELFGKAVDKAKDTPSGKSDEKPKTKAQGETDSSTKTDASPVENGT